MQKSSSLNKLRGDIDEIDKNLVNLLCKRAQIAKKIGSEKQNSGKDIFSPSREKIVYEKVLDFNKDNSSPLPKISLKAIFREIMSTSLYLECKFSVAFLGPMGSWSHQAATAKFGKSTIYRPQLNIEDVFTTVARNKSDCGIVPIENSYEGSVNQTLDSLANTNLEICGEFFMKIINCLVVIPGTKINSIKHIYSHPQVIGQCQKWISINLPQATIHEVSSTSKAGEILKNTNNCENAILASEHTAHTFGLEILEKSVQDDINNTTRFLIISHKSAEMIKKNRSSLLITLKNEPGALTKALKPFDENDINLLKIVSRPKKNNKQWEYFFFIDFEGHTNDPQIQSTIKKVSQYCAEIKILGSYPNTSGEFY